MMQPSVLFLVPYPHGVAPSQRFRVELYEPMLRQHGIQYEIAGFMDETTWSVIFKKGHHLQKIGGILKGFIRRIGHLWKAKHFDYVFIHREAAPLGPPVIEWIIAKVLRKKIVYDFDDAIWIPNITAGNELARLLKSYWKVGYICKWSYVVTGGNHYLNAFAERNGAQQTLFLPTCVDVMRKHNLIKTHHSGKPVVGWTGSHSTLFYLDTIVDLIRKLQTRLDFTFLVIADKKPELDLVNWDFVRWNEATEVEDLLRMDIGIMPLKADAWSEGKCGFKLIQYMSCGIPALADPVGVNSDIISSGEDGFLCENAEDWEGNLERLIKDPELRRTLGMRGRKKIEAQYSIQSQTTKFVSLFSK